MRRLLDLLGDVRLHRGLVVFAFFAPIAYGLWQAFVDPRIEFLPPSVRADWALHPTQDILTFQHGRVSKDVEFARRFRLEEAPSTFVVRVRAFTTCRVFINAAELSPVRTRTNWKRAQEYDAADALNVGDNLLRIRVSNAGAIPALLVESPSALRTRGEWKASLEPEFNDWKDVVPPTFRAAQPGPLQMWSGWRWARWLVVAWLSGTVALVAFSSARAIIRRRYTAASPRVQT
jgi:hypothetical protein